MYTKTDGFCIKKWSLCHLYRSIHKRYEDLNTWRMSPNLEACLKTILSTCLFYKNLFRVIKTPESICRFLSILKLNNYCNCIKTTLHMASGILFVANLLIQQSIIKYLVMTNGFKTWDFSILKVHCLSLKFCILVDFFLLSYVSMIVACLMIGLT